MLAILMTLKAFIHLLIWKHIYFLTANILQWHLSIIWGLSLALSLLARALWSEAYHIEVLLKFAHIALNWWKGKPSGSIACTRKQQPRFYWSCSSVVMKWMSGQCWGILLIKQPRQSKLANISSPIAVHRQIIGSSHSIHICQLSKHSVKSVQQQILGRCGCPSPDK